MRWRCGDLVVEGMPSCAFSWRIVSPKNQMPSIVQSILIRKDIPLAEARAIVRRNGFVAEKVDETEDYHRFRQRRPMELERLGYRFRTVPFGEHGKMIVAISP